MQVLGEIISRRDVEIVKCVVLSSLERIVIVIVHRHP